MNQNIWGPSLWLILHSITLLYPLDPCQKDKDNMMQFLQGLGHVVLCDICKTHYNRNLKENPPRLDNRKDFFEWMVDFHNEVNGRTGKRSYTYEEVRQIYNTKYNNTFELVSKNGNNLTPSSILRKLHCYFIQYNLHLVILILIAIIIYLLYFK